MTDCVIGYVINEEIGDLTDIVNAIAGDHCKYLSSINGNPVFKAWSDKGADGQEFGSFGVMLVNSSTQQAVSNVQQFESFTEDRSLWLSYSTLLKDTLEDSSTDTNLMSLFALPPIQIGPGDSTTVLFVMSFAETNSTEGDAEILEAMQHVLGTSDVHDVSDVQQLEIYPQPLIDGEVLQVRSAHLITLISVYDLTGRLIHTTTPSAMSTTIDGLKTGVCILSIEYEGGKRLRRAIVVN